MLASESVEDRAAFAAWMPPSAAIDLLKRANVNFEIAARMLGDRIKGGVIEVMAERAVFPERKPIRHVALQPSEFRYWAPLEDRSFWRTGDLKLRNPDVASHDSEETSVWLFAVRLDPEAVRTALPASAAGSAARLVAPGMGSKDKRRLPDGILQRWAALFNELNPETTEAKARAAIEAMFPDHHVTVRDLRRVLPERSAGRRSKPQ
ncbi:MAG TPA: hypothetical protein VF499_02715 [Afipia sp.]